MVTDIINYCKQFRAELNPYQVSTMMAANTPAYLDAMAWFTWFLSLVGDQCPNSTEIHLEMQDVKDIYQEYADEMTYLLKSPLSYSRFTRMWVDCFSYAKIRMFKSCGGKCKICAVQTEARSSTHDPEKRKHITWLHKVHRSMYMGERLAYHQRQAACLYTDPNTLSLAGDWMDSCKTKLPWWANLNQYKFHFDMSVACFICHGFTKDIYRSFTNLPKNANLQMHCFLLALEKWINKRGRYPDIIYYQVLIYKMF